MLVVKLSVMAWVVRILLLTVLVLFAGSIADAMVAEFKGLRIIYYGRNSLQVPRLFSDFSERLWWLELLGKRFSVC